jgi:hypothetical protein
MAKGFQCDKCERMFIGDSVKEFESGEFRVIYCGTGDICRFCMSKEVMEAIKPPLHKGRAGKERSEA